MLSCKKNHKDCSKVRKNDSQKGIASSKLVSPFVLMSHYSTFSHIFSINKIILHYHIFRITNILIPITATVLQVMSFLVLPHSAQTWILNPSCALMRARVGYKIRFDQPTHPPTRLLDFLRILWCVPTLI